MMEFLRFADTNGIRSKSRYCVCMARSRKVRRSERDREAMKVRHQGFSAAGPSLLESLESLLLRRMGKYYEVKCRPEDTPDYLGEYESIRGECVGISRCIAKIRLPYEDQRIVTKNVFKEFYRKVKDNG